MQVKYNQKLFSLEIFSINEDGQEFGNRVNQMPSGWEEFFLDEALREERQGWKKLFAMPDHHVIFAISITNLIERYIMLFCMWIKNESYLWYGRKVPWGRGFKKVGGSGNGSDNLSDCKKVESRHDPRKL